LPGKARIARRLGRLFRLERAGAFSRRSAETAWRLIARRGELMAELIPDRASPPRGAGAGVGRFREQRSTNWPPRSRLSRTYGETLVAGLGAELRARRGETAPSGLRHSGGGRLLGRG